MTDARRLARYHRIRDQIAELIAKTTEPAAHRATTAALLHHKLPGASWTGFYLLRGDDLVVDAYQGPVACLVLARHAGVCWAGIERRSSIVVEDVHAFPGHIACDAGARSEVVVPILGPDGVAVGVLDVDSHRPAHFDEVDREGYESVIRMLEQVWFAPATRLS